VTIRRLHVEVSGPRDLSVGDTAVLEVTLTGRGRCDVRALDPTGDWHRCSAPGTMRIHHLADRRGIYGVVRIEVQVTAPLGVLAAHRVHVVTLPVVVEVAPRPLAVAWHPAAAPTDGTGVDGQVAGRVGDLVRSVRPYVSGDPAHLVHWPSSARVGSLVVREFEPPRPVGQAVVVDLRELGPDTERAAAYALGAAIAVLRGGGALIMATCEASGPVVGHVRTPLDAGRRLARAVPGPPGTPPADWPIVEIGS